MRHSTVLFFWGLVVAVVLWVGFATVIPHRERWSARYDMMGPASLLAGPGAWRPAYMAGGGPYVLSPAGGSPQIADVERALNDWLAREGNPRLKLAPVTEKNASRFQAEIVTQDGSLVQRFEIDRRSGQLTPVED